jgi:beta-galactosidase
MQIITGTGNRKAHVERLGGLFLPMRYKFCCRSMLPHFCGNFHLPVLILMSIFLASVYPVAAFGPEDVGMFPATAVARPYIHFDGKGFVINGRRTFIASGSMHYARVPRALWADRLLKMKRAGFNTVETYIFWSYQEPREGKCDFKGRHNLAAFLALVHKLGLYAILRVGPYCDGEWSQGGWPVWLRFIPGIAVREADKPFLDAVNSYFNKLLPIVAANQINHGGAVIMVQLENEDSQGWGNVIPNGYYKFLYTKARAMGLDVPMFFSGMHHGTNAAGAGPWSTRDRTCPWLTTEMHTGWFNLYRTHPPWLSRLTHQAMWQVIAYGGNGYDAYLAVGGTTPSYDVNGPVGPSYDFCAPIGQAGDLRPLYYIYKTANYFARSFQRILETSINVRHVRWTVPQGVRVFERKSPNGDITYFQNLFYMPVRVALPGSCTQTIAGGHLFPVISAFDINKTFTLRLSCARIFGIFRQAATTSLVCYGPPDSPVLFRLAVHAVINDKSRAFTHPEPHSSDLTLRVKVPARGPDIYIIKAGKKILRIFVESRQTMHHTWYLPIGGQPALVCGPDYTGSVSDRHGHIVLHTQSPWSAHVPLAKVYFAGSSRPVVLRAAAIKIPAAAESVKAPALGAWKYRLADGPAMPGYPDQSWIRSVNPVQMGVGDYPGLHQWYRVKISVASAGKYRIVFSGLRDSADVFINGRLVEAGPKRIVHVSLDAGVNTLAVLAISHGRPKLWTYIGPYNSIASMGIWGHVLLFGPGKQSKAVPIRNWRMRGGIGRENTAYPWRALSNLPGVPAFYRTRFDYQPRLGAPHLVLRVAWGKLDGGYMWINGHNLGRYPDPFMRMGLYIPSCWLNAGKNTLEIFDQRGNDPQSVHLVIEQAASRRYVKLYSRPPQ